MDGSRVEGLPPISLYSALFSGISRGGARGGLALPPLFWVKKEEMTEGRKASRGSKTRPGLHLSSKSGSATALSSTHFHLQLNCKSSKITLVIKGNYLV